MGRSRQSWRTERVDIIAGSLPWAPRTAGRGTAAAAGPRRGPARHLHPRR